MWLLLESSNAGLNTLTCAVPGCTAFDMHMLCLFPSSTKWPALHSSCPHTVCWICTDIEDSSAYTPSFGSTLRGGPNPFNSMTPAEQPTDARQRRVLPDSSVRSSMTSGVGAGGSSNAPKSKEEQERERTAAAMAAALARRQQLQQSTPAVAPAPAVQSATGGSNVGFR